MSNQRRACKLTKRAAETAEIGAGRYVLWDTEKKGFGLRVERSGIKTFIVRYRAGNGGRKATQRELAIGRFGNWSVDSARAEAGRILNAVDSGRDPASERRHKRQELTVSELCDLYVAEGMESKKPSTRATDIGRIERHIKPLLGSRAVSEVTQGDVERFMTDVARGRSKADIKTRHRGRAIVSGGRGTASRTVGLLGGIFSFAVRRSLRETNPVRGVQRYPDRLGQRFLTPEELLRLGEALRQLDNEGANASAIAAIRLLALTGARKGEVYFLRWSEVDLDHLCLRLSDSKTGAKIIPIGKPAKELLSQLPRGPGEFVFPAETGTGPYQGTDRVWRRVRRLASLENVRLHDLRHSFASVGASAGDSLPIIGKLLGHADVETTARYAHLADNPVIAAADRISSKVAAAMNGSVESSADILEDSLDK